MRNGFLAWMVLLAASAASVFAHGNEPGRAALEVSGGEIVIEYGAPALNGRDLMEMIKQPGANPWRLGADGPTTLSTPVALQFGESVLAPGKYGLRAYLDDSGAWWLQAYDNDRNVVGKLALKSSMESESKEHLEIALSGDSASATVRIQWGTQSLAGHLSVAE